MDFPLTTDNLEKKEFKIGTLYFNKKYVLTHFKEGIDINYNNFKEVGNFIKSYFNGKEFGYIANRVNSYSINLEDAKIFNESFPNLKAYAIVAHSTFTEKIFEIENHFFPYNRKAFKNMEDAVEWVEGVLD